VNARYRDLVSGCFLLICAVFIYVNSLFIVNLTGALIGPAFVPQVLAVLLGVSSIVVIIGGIKKIKTETDSSAGTQKAETTTVIKKPFYQNAVLLTILNLITFIALLGKIGVVIMISFYLFSQFLILTPKKIKRIYIYVIGSIVVSVLLNEIFTKGFQLMLPQGILR
jgi:putative tricarboxylic transport membrane protein